MKLLGVIEDIPNTSFIALFALEIVIILWVILTENISAHGGYQWWIDAL